MTHKQLPKEFYDLMEEYQAVRFAAVELNLYLDTHPYDANAIKEYNNYTKKQQELKQKIESTYGPLQHFGNSYAGYPWNWDEPPWPWQM